MNTGYWIFDEYEDDWVYIPSAEELSLQLTLNPKRDIMFVLNQKAVNSLKI